MSQPNLDLPVVLADIRRQAVAIAQRAWPELGVILDDILPDPMEPFALIPICTGIACGANMDGLTPLAAVIVVAAYALRIVDDCADEDDPSALHLSIGDGRAVNAAVALSTAASYELFRSPFPVGRKAILLDEYHQAFLRICEGQDQDMRGFARSLPEYCTIVQAKTVAAFEFAALAGASLATDDAAAIQRCRTCGAQLGWMIQMLDDIEALWFPDGPSDLSGGRLTFPVLYGLTIDHPALPMLQELSSADVYDTTRICSVLDQMNVRRRLMTHALDHRDAALAALDPPLLPAGRAILQLWLDWLLRDAGRLLGN
jgi:geranylgeranyl diphosphate synthase type I